MWFKTEKLDFCKKSLFTICKLFYFRMFESIFSQLELVLILDSIQLLFVAHAFTVMSGYHQHQDQNLTIDLRFFESMFYTNKIFSKNITI